jgi:hypothetical protein
MADLEIAAAGAIGVELGTDDDSAPRPKLKVCTIRRIRTIDGVSVDANGYIDLGSPRADLSWDLRRIIIFNGTPWAAGQSGSLAAVFVGNPQSNNQGLLSLSECVAPGLIPPWFADFPEKGCIRVSNRQHLYIVVNGGSGNEIAGATVLETDAED